MYTYVTNQNARQATLVGAYGAKEVPNSDHATAACRKHKKGASANNRLDPFPTLSDHSVAAPRYPDQTDRADVCYWTLIYLNTSKMKYRRQNLTHGYDKVSATSDSRGAYQISRPGALLKDTMSILSNYSNGWRP